MPVRDAIRITCLLAGALALEPARPASHGEPVRVIAYVDAAGDRVQRSIDKFVAQLDRLGVTSRHPVVVRRITADMYDDEDIRRKVRDAVRAKPAILIATNSSVAAIAKEITSDIPVVFGSWQDPVLLGLVSSLARPGGNLTGFTNFAPIDEKRLELLRIVAPQAKRIGVIVDRWWLADLRGQAVLDRAARRFGFEARAFHAETPAQLRRELDTPAARGMDAWFVPNTALAFEDPAALLASAIARKPVMFPMGHFVDSGGLMAYETVLSLDEALALFAKLSGLVLDGMSPADIPVERPKAFRLSVNAAAARRMGTQLPAALVKRADRVLPGDGH